MRKRIDHLIQRLATQHRLEHTEYQELIEGRTPEAAAQVTRAVKDGYGGSVLFVIQMDNVKCLHPNDATDPNFGKALREAAVNGVEVIAMDCAVTETEMTIRNPVPVRL